MKKSELRQLIKEELLNEINDLKDVRRMLDSINKAMDKEFNKVSGKVSEELVQEFRSAQRVFNDTVIDLSRNSK